METCALCGVEVDPNYEGCNCVKCGRFVCVNCQWHIGNDCHCEECYEEERS